MKWISSALCTYFDLSPFSISLPRFTAAYSSAITCFLLLKYQKSTMKKSLVNSYFGQNHRLTSICSFDFDVLLFLHTCDPATLCMEYVLKPAFHHAFRPTDPACCGVYVGTQYETGHLAFCILHHWWRWFSIVVVIGIVKLE